MCLDNKKLLSLETVMATNPWMYSRSQKSNMEKRLPKRFFSLLKNILNKKNNSNFQIVKKLSDALAKTCKLKKFVIIILPEFSKFAILSC
jgi:hypothetical protein